MDGSKEDYLGAKKSANLEVYNAKKAVQETQFHEINSEKDFNKMFKLAKNMKFGNIYVTGNKCVEYKNKNLVLFGKEKLCV